MPDLRKVFRTTSARGLGIFVLLGASLLYAGELSLPQPAAGTNSIGARLLSFLGVAPKSAAGAAGIEWVTIPGGTFMMGAEIPDQSPRHRVTVPTFHMAKTLVTSKQYSLCYKAGACPPLGGETRPGLMGNEDQPAVAVSWNQAQAFAKWAGGRLPSEAQWEFAARSGGEDRTYPWGDAAATCENAVVTDGSGRGCGHDAPWPVCSKPKGNTKQGLCDMAGNAWQWVQDSYHGSYDGAPTDGSSWEGPAGLGRVYRGGGWCSDLETTTYRGHRAPNDTNQGIGFRIVR